MSDCGNACIGCPSKCGASSSGIFTPTVSAPRIPTDEFISNMKPTETRATGYVFTKPAAPRVRGFDFKTAGVLSPVGGLSNGYGNMPPLPGQRDSEVRSGPVTAGTSIGYADTSVSIQTPSYDLVTKAGNPENTGQANRTDWFKLPTWALVAGAVVLAIVVLK